MSNSGPGGRRAVHVRGHAKPRQAIQRRREQDLVAAGQDHRPLLERILNTPGVEHVIPRLPPELLHRVIERCGLEDCGELVALATPAQLQRVLDLDLWRPCQPGQDHRFDADRFGAWLDVLIQEGAETAARQLASLDIDLAVTGIAQCARVFDAASLIVSEPIAGEGAGSIDVAGDALSAEIGGYLIVARRTGSWTTIIDTLTCLHSDHHQFFDDLMRGCRRLSNSDPEIDGLHDLLTDRDQAMFDVAEDRGRRLREQGFATPADARAFLELSRQRQPSPRGDATAGSVTLAARTYFRDLETSAAADPAEPGLNADAGSHAGYTDAVTAMVETLREAGVVAAQPRALLENPQPEAPKLARMHGLLAALHDCDPSAYAIRSQELAHLANMLIAGCSIQGRPFNAEEASAAAAAVCNLGLENWPAPLTDTFLIRQDLVAVFQAGWACLHHDVCMYAASQLVDVLTHVRCGDRSIQRALDFLRLEIRRYSLHGAPWRARDALEVIGLLDLPAWAALVALIDECPVLHAAVAASRQGGTLRVSATAFEFFSENRQIAAAREFLHALPDILSR